MARAVIDIPSPLRLRLDTAALQANWRMLDRMSGTAACGAAVKADGYGLGAVGVATRLAEVGCRDFFVATWAEAQALAPLGVTVSVLHGVRAADMPAALALPHARPVLNTPAQVARWREAGGGACDVMVDTGMNRLGLAAADLPLVAGLTVDTLMSHLACADEDSPMNERQRTAFAALRQSGVARRYSLANSAGVALGEDYAFDLTRPGLAIYGGRPRREFSGLTQVAVPEAQVLQRRTVRAGDSVGYNATWTASKPTELAVIGIGYADGYFRSFAGQGSGWTAGSSLPLLGRISMDLIALNVDEAPGVSEGDWITVGFDLPSAAFATGMSQYELLTSFGSRYRRYW